MNFLRQKAETITLEPPSMSTKTKIFIQKICYKKTASVDMTTHGFINDKKLNGVNFLLKPLREQLERILGKRTETAITVKKSHLRKRVYKERMGRHGRPIIEPVAPLLSGALGGRPTALHPNAGTVCNELVLSVPDPKPFKKTVHIKEGNLSRQKSKDKSQRKRVRKVKTNSASIKKVCG